MASWFSAWRAAAQDPQWRRHWREGARDTAGAALGIGAWGLVTGVALVNTGLSVPTAVLMTLLVYAGSAQLATAPLMAAGAPLLVVWATALCLNLRFVIFSVQWRPYFLPLSRRQRALAAYFATDLNYVVFMRRWPRARPEAGQIAYYCGSATVTAVAWQAMSMLGIVLAQRVPAEWGLGFAGTMALLAMTVQMLGDRSAWLPALVAGGAAVVAFALPLKLNMLVAIFAAVAVGMAVDRVAARQRAAAAAGGSADPDSGAPR